MGVALQEQRIDVIPGAYCVFGAPWQTAKRKTIIWGDSHAQHFAPIIDAMNADPERSFMVFAGCSAALGDELFLAVPDAARYAERCKFFHSNGVKLLKEDASITQVILTSNWMDLPWRVQGHPTDGLSAMASSLTKLIKETSAPERRFFLIGMVPRIPAEVVACAVLESSKLLRRPCISTVQSSDALAVRRTSAPTDEMLIEVAKSFPKAAAVIPADKMCRDDACEIFLDGEFLYRDTGHIRRNLRFETRRHFAEWIGLTAALSEDRQDAAARAGALGAEVR